MTFNTVNTRIARLIYIGYLETVLVVISFYYLFLDDFVYNIEYRPIIIYHTEISVILYRDITHY